MRHVSIETTNEKWEVDIPTEHDWASCVAQIAHRLRVGDVLLLEGPLGAGKTTFVQALAHALGGAKRPSSPTFSLLRVYAVRSAETIRRLIHVDAYRLDHENDVMALDLEEELADGQSILAIEWPEQIAGWIKKLPPERVFRVHIALG